MLRNEGCQDIRPCRFAFRPETGRGCNQAALPDFQFLQADLAAIPGQGEDIHVFGAMTDDGLLVHQPFQSRDPVPQDCRLLKAQLFRGSSISDFRPSSSTS